MAKAFVAARKADPGKKIKLFLNDFYCEGNNSKSDVVYAIVKNLTDRQIPIDGVGLQMHLNAGSDAQPGYGGDANFGAEVSWNIARLAALGVEVRVTEMDVTCGGYSHSCDDNVG